MILNLIHFNLLSLFGGDFDNLYHLYGFSALKHCKTINDLQGLCNWCMEANLVFTTRTLLSKPVLKEAQPFKQISNSTINDPLVMVVLDETGPLLIYNQNKGPKECPFLSVYLLRVADLLTYHPYLSPIKSIATSSIICRMERVQNLCGRLTNVVFDDHLSHHVIQGKSSLSPSLIQNFTDNGPTPLWPPYEWP